MVRGGVDALLTRDEPSVRCAELVRETLVDFLGHEAQRPTVAPRRRGSQDLQGLVGLAAVRGAEVGYHALPHGTRGEHRAQGRSDGFAIDVLLSHGASPSSIRPYLRGGDVARATLSGA